MHLLKEKSLSVHDLDNEGNPNYNDMKHMMNNFNREFGARLEKKIYIGIAKIVAGASKEDLAKLEEEYDKIQEEIVNLELDMTDYNKLDSPRKSQTRVQEMLSVGKSLDQMMDGIKKMIPDYKKPIEQLDKNQKDMAKSLKDNDKEQKRHKDAIRQLCEFKDLIEGKSDENEENKNKVGSAMQKLTQSLSYFKIEFNEKMNDNTNLLKDMEKRVNYAFTEIDGSKHQMTQAFKLFPRLDNAETKLQDLFDELKAVKANIPPSAEALVSELKQINISFQKFKNNTTKVFDEHRDMIQKLSESKGTQLLEDRMISRMDDIVRALTRALVNRNEFEKKQRLVEHQISNLFQLMLLDLQGERQTLTYILKSVDFTKKLQGPRCILDEYDRRQNLLEEENLRKKDDNNLFVSINKFGQP